MSWEKNHDTFGIYFSVISLLILHA